LTRTQYLLRDNTSLQKKYNELQANDLIIGRVRLRPTEEHLLLDLVDRGIICIPSAKSQLLSRSKTFQAKLFSSCMLPDTMIIHDLNDLLLSINRYQTKYNRVITKQERKNAGLGVHLWSTIEDVYTQASLGVLPFPFVLQPYYSDCRDIRVIVMGSYLEAYWRYNPNSFRNNLHFGGDSSPCNLEEEQVLICRKIMEKGRFPYAHLDFMVTEDNKFYFTEINLRGGLRGARISATEYKEKMAEIHEALASEATIS
jgi:glutathione synthase/RimK-type ligase-like ATP-grasp enzyme